MARIDRVCRRRWWREDSPPHFNVANKKRAASALNHRLAPRLSFVLWQIKTYRPALYAKLVDRALDKAVDKGDAERVNGEVVVGDPLTLDKIEQHINAARSAGVVP